MEFELMMEAIRRRLPLAIERAEYSNESLSLGSDIWSFNSLSPWRILKSSRLSAGSDQEGAADELRELVGRRIVAIGFQAAAAQLDPSFELDDGRIIEVFSCHHLEPWVFRLPDLIIVAQPCADNAG